MCHYKSLHAPGETQYGALIVPVGHKGLPMDNCMSQLDTREDNWNSASPCGTLGETQWLQKVHGGAPGETH